MKTKTIIKTSVIGLLLVGLFALAGVKASAQVTVSYGGHDWKVWYTDTIALPYGPWLLNGAKGIVLKALDTENNFIFTAEGLTQKPQPIIRYEWSRKVMGKAEWKRFERDMYENAGAFVRNTGARILIMDNSEQGYHRLTEDWQQFYNPLEK